jgi:hypothetical protein
MPVVIEDAYGHRSVSGASALTAGAVSTTAAGTIAPTTSAGASPTVTFGTGQAANDVRGVHPERGDRRRCSGRRGDRRGDLHEPVRRGPRRVSR